MRRPAPNLGQALRSSEGVLGRDVVDLFSKKKRLGGRCKMDNASEAVCYLLLFDVVGDCGSGLVKKHESKQ